VYIIKAQPFESKKLNGFEMFNELTVLLISYTMLLLTDFYPGLIRQYNVGWFLVLVTLLNILINMIHALIITIVQLFKDIRKFYAKMKMKY
jgi:hypothetical protein